VVCLLNKHQAQELQVVLSDVVSHSSRKQVMTVVYLLSMRQAQEHQIVL
jgi:hypothetical protein